MQFIVISHQLWEIFASFLLGTGLGFLYDCVRFIRSLVPDIRLRRTVSNVLDMVYMTIFGGSYCILLFALSSGRFRWFTFLSLFIGVLLYRILPSRFIMLIFSFVSDMIYAFVRTLFKPLISIIEFTRKSISAFICRVKTKRLIKRTDKIQKELNKTVKLM